MSIDSFLSEILGQSGAQALLKSDKSAHFGDVVFTRAVLSWLDLHNGGFEGAIPGTNIAFAFFKKEDLNYKGSVYINGKDCKFNSLNIYQLAGLIATSLDAKPPQKLTKKEVKQLSSLGSSIDLLVKAQVTITELKKANKPNNRNIDYKETHEGAGPAAAPKEPEGPIEPDATQDKLTPGIGVMGTAVGSSHVTKKPKIKLPKVSRVKLPGVKVSKSQSEGKCNICDKNHFKLDKFIGCFCLSYLAKNVDTIIVPTGYLLKFNKMDQEEVLAIVDALLFKDQNG